MLNYLLKKLESMPGTYYDQELMEERLSDAEPLRSSALY